MNEQKKNVAEQLKYGHQRFHNLEGEYHILPGWVCDPSVGLHDFVYIDNSGLAQRCLADSRVSGDSIGVVIDKPGTIECRVKYHGLIKWKDSSLIAGKQYFLSADEYGITIVPPDGPGEILKRIGIAQAADVLFVDVTRPLLIRS